MVEVKVKPNNYKDSYWKTPGKPLFWNAKTRTVKQEDAMTDYGITPKYSKGKWVKTKGWFVDKKLAVEKKEKYSYIPKTLASKTKKFK